MNILRVHDPVVHGLTLGIVPPSLRSTAAAVAGPADDLTALSTVGLLDRLHRSCNWLKQHRDEGHPLIPGIWWVKEDSQLASVVIRARQPRSVSSRAVI